MRSNRGLNSDERVDEAAWEATKGAAVGAAKWGLAGGILGVAGYTFSPVYRGLTVQFKVFLQLSAMTLGSMIEGDRRLRQFERRVRLERKFHKDQAVWRHWEQQLEEAGSLKSSDSEQSSS